MSNISIFDPRTMGRVIERMPRVHTFFRSTFFRRVKTFSTKSIDVDFKKGNRALAPFVHPKIGGKTVPNKGFQTKTYTPPLVAPNKITTVSDLEQRRAGENIYSGRTAAERAIEKMAEDFRELDEMITRREEWMAAQAIFTGKIPVIGDGLNEEIDFSFTNKETLTTKWSAAGADPISDLKRWRKHVQKTGFINPNICIMADDVAAAFINNAKVQKLLDIKAYDLAVIKPRELPNGVTYVGTINGLGLDIYTYNEWYLDDWSNPEAPVQMPLVPDGKLALLSTTAAYSRYYAAVTILDGRGGDEDFRTVEGARIPDSWAERNPARRFLQLNSQPLPVPHEVDSWFVATVL
ncbi:MAG: major capsid protein [Defluviitaleaceae bacterium]|nr:major capsid protein [Defluviitaleaceae bacterium]